MKAITLQSRIIILLTIFTIITAVAFVAVQLSHELSITTEREIYKANIVSMVIEEKVDKISGLSATEEERIKALNNAIRSFKKSNLIAMAYVFNRAGKVVTATEKWLIGGDGDSVDSRIAGMIKSGRFRQKEAFVDKARSLFSIFFPIKETGRVNFALRVFFPMGDIAAVIGQVYRPMAILAAALIVINILLGAFLSRVVINPIKVFNEAAKTIASGRLELKVDIQTGDELEELGSTFNNMTVQLIKMKSIAENANPLTKLPGNIVIMEDVEKRIKEGGKFTVIYCDLDNFKAFNDKYGIHKGDDAIKMTGDIFKEAIKAKGVEADFVGHEGGDDFLLVTTPDRAQGIADFITSEFDKQVRALYSKEDLDRGHIVAHARDGSVKEFPIMSISLAGVTNQHHPIANYAEVTNIAAEIKKKAKAKEGSNFVVDERKA